MRTQLAIVVFSIFIILGCGDDTPDTNIDCDKILREAHIMASKVFDEGSPEYDVIINEARANCELLKRIEGY